MKTRTSDGVQYLAICMIWLIHVTISLASESPLSNYRFAHLTIDEGLSQNVVTAILQDERGFMWFGTQDGLNRYDGYRFLTFKHDPEDPTSLSGNYIDQLYQVPGESVIWIGTYNGLNRYDPKTMTFRSFRHKPGEPNSLSSNRILSIVAADNDHLWVGSEFGLDRIHKSGTVEKVLGRSVHNKLDQEFFSTVYPDPVDEGTVWVGTKHGLIRMDQSGRNLEIYRSLADNTNSLSSDRIASITRGSGSDAPLWVGTWQGLNRFDPENRSIRRIVHDPNRENGLANDHVTAIVPGLGRHEGRLWLSTFGGGLHLYDPEKDTFRRISYDVLDEGMGSQFGRSLYRDRTGALWIGTYGAGVGRFNPGEPDFQHLTPNPGRGDGRALNGIFAIQPDEGTGGDRLWIGIQDGGLARMDRASGEVRRYQHIPGSREGLSNNRIRGICQDQQGMVWLATSAGLNRFDPETERFRYYFNDPDDPRSLSSNNLTVVTMFNDTLWVGTFDSGISCLPADRFDKDEEATRFDNLTHLPGNPDSVSHNQIGGLYPDPHENILWITTFGGGLNRYDPQSGIFSHYRSDKRHEEQGLWKKALSNDFAFGVYKDRSDRLWIGTLGGLNRLSLEKGRFRHYREKDGLPNETILGVLGDEQGFLWLSTNKGLSRFDPETETFHNYDVHDGLQSNEFNQGAYAKSAAGELFFGGLNGLNAFFPANIKEDPILPVTVITDFRMFNRSVPLQHEDPTSPLTASISETQHLELTHLDAVFSFEFASLHFANPRRNRYAYQLEGFDKVWIYTTAERRYAVYTKLDAGTYRFRVKGTNQDGRWSHEEAQIQLKILSAPWWTLQARILYLLTLISGVLAWIRRHNKKLTREREINLKLRQADRLKDEFVATLEEKVAERTQSLDERNRELETLDDIVKTINREVNHQNVLQTIMDQGLCLFPRADHGLFFLWERPHRIFRMIAATGYPQDMPALVLTHEQVFQTLLRHAVQIEKSIYLDKHFDEIAGSLLHKDMPIPKTVIAMNLILDGRLYGFLALSNSEDRAAFDSSDGLKLKRFREHAVSAVFKSRILLELREKNREILRTQNQLLLQEKMASLGTMTAGIAHEIKNPLNFINNFARISGELLQEIEADLEIDASQISRYQEVMENLENLRQNATLINDHGKRANQIVQSMMAMVHGDVGVIAATDLNNLVDRSYKMACHGIRTRACVEMIEIETDYASDVSRWHLVPQTFTRSLINIFTNALEAAWERKQENPSFKPCLKVCTRTCDEGVEIVIRDNGKGIDTRKVAQIYNPFYTTKPTGHGNIGLGLSIAYDIIVLEHGGSIKVDSTPGSFTEVTVRIPPGFADHPARSLT